MKKALLVSFVAAALGLSTAALAQTAGPVGGPPKAPLATGKGAKAGRLGKKEMERINEEALAKLNLTDDQRAKIKAHEDETATQETVLRKRVKAAKKGGAADPDATEKLKALRKEDKAFMKGILTKPQMRELARLRREAVAEHEAKTAPVAPAPAPTKP